MLYSTFKFVRDFIRTLDEGITWDNLVKLLGDIIGMALGAYLAFGRIGAGISLVVGGTALIVSAFRDIIKNGMNLYNTLGLIAGLLTAGLGISILTKSWIPMAIAAIAKATIIIITFELIYIYNSLLHLFYIIHYRQEKKKNFYINHLLSLEKRYILLLC